MSRRPACGGQSLELEEPEESDELDDESLLDELDEVSLDVLDDGLDDPWSFL